ncbi:hypothetical protein WI73_11330 [Burkholderia ubonensis]|nr:hypothetical protein WI73_11330 [Burkholderia ubonensis]
MKRDPEGSFVLASDVGARNSRADALTDGQRSAINDAARVLEENWEFESADRLLTAFAIKARADYTGRLDEACSDSPSSQPAAAPIPMLLFCPRCGAQHIDAPETKPDDQDDRVPVTTWTNPPHRSHLCHACGTIWRPADVATVGVAAIETHGKDDTWTASMPWIGHNRPPATSANEIGAEGAKPVAWFIDWPDEPELGHYFAEEPCDPKYGRSRALGFIESRSPAMAAAAPLARKTRNPHRGGTRAYLATEHFNEGWNACLDEIAAYNECVVAEGTAAAQPAAVPGDERAAYSIEGIVRFMRSEAEKQVCVCCPPGGGHIFSRRVEWDEWKTNRAAHFGNGPDVLIGSKVLDLNQNEGKRVRVTVEVLDEARPAASPAAEAVTIPAGWKPMPIDAPEPLLDVLCDAARGWPTYAEVRPIYDKLLAAAPQPAQAGAPAEARELIGPHDLSTSAGGRAYVAEFFAKRLRRHDFASYIAERLAADFACALAVYLRDTDGAPADAGSGDAIARSKRILALVDDYHEKPTSDNRTALRKALMAEFETAPPAARVAILTSEQVSEVWDSMPGGGDGFMKQWGYYQFALEILNLAQLLNGADDAE